MICAPGGRAATSEIAMLPSARRNHSMCVSPVVHAEHVERATLRGSDVVVPRAVDLAWQHQAPLDPRILQHVERRRVVVRERVPDRLAIDRNRLERVLLARGRTPRAAPGSPWTEAAAASAAAQLVAGPRRDRSAARPHRPAASPRSGNPSASANARRRRTKAPAGVARTAARRRAAASSSAPCRGSWSPLPPTAPAGLTLRAPPPAAPEAARYAPNSRSTVPFLNASSAGRPDQLVDVEDIRDPPVRHASVQVAQSVGGIVRDDPEPHAGQRGRRLHHSHGIVGQQGRGEDDEHDEESEVRGQPRRLQALPLHPLRVAQATGPDMSNPGAYGPTRVPTWPPFRSGAPRWWRRPNRGESAATPRSRW